MRRSHPDMARFASASAALCLSLCVTAPAGAQEAGPEVEPPTPAVEGEEAVTAEATPACNAFDLRGATEQSQQPGVTFTEEWRPSLEAAAACLAAAGNEQGCVEVQGQYDDHTFDTAVARSMGGQRAAQIHRARGRSEAVVTELDSMGVPYERIRHRPPPAEPTYRGVRIRIIVDCVADTPPVEMPEWAETPEALSDTLNETGLLVVHGASAPPEPPAPAVGPFSVDGALSFGYILQDPNDSFTFGVRTAFGWGEDRYYARALFAVGTGDALEQRATVEWGVSGGFRPERWLRVGGIFTQRFGTYHAFDPWLEQSWFLGAELEQRIVDLGRVSVWVGETIYPIGFRTQRASVDQGQIIDSADRTDYSFRAELQITVRGHIARGAGLPGSPPGTR